MKTSPLLQDTKKKKMIYNYLLSIPVRPEFWLMMFLFPLTGWAQTPADAFDSKWHVTRAEIEWDAEKHTGILPFTVLKLSLDQKGLPVSGTFRIEMAELEDTDIEYELMQQVLINTLKSAEWFDTENHPAAYFEIGSFEPTEHPDLYFVNGNLKIRKVTNPIRFLCIIEDNGKEIRIQSECIGFNRLLWGIDTWSAKTAKEKDDMIVSDLFNIEVNLHYKRK
jgi:hypothetical protein